MSLGTNEEESPSTWECLENMMETLIHEKEFKGFARWQTELRNYEQRVRIKYRYGEGESVAPIIAAKEDSAANVLPEWKT